jgi:hypothetical protein
VYSFFLLKPQGFFARGRIVAQAARGFFACGSVEVSFFRSVLRLRRKTERNFSRYAWCSPTGFFLLLSVLQLCCKTESNFYGQLCSTLRCRRRKRFLR